MGHHAAAQAWSDSLSRLCASAAPPRLPTSPASGEGGGASGRHPFVINDPQHCLHHAVRIGFKPAAQARIAVQSRMSLADALPASDLIGKPNLVGSYLPPNI